MGGAHFQLYLKSIPNLGLNCTPLIPSRSPVIHFLLRTLLACMAAHVSMSR